MFCGQDAIAWPNWLDLEIRRSPLVAQQSLPDQPPLFCTRICMHPLAMGGDPNTARGGGEEGPLRGSQWSEGRHGREMAVAHGNGAFRGGMGNRFIGNR